MNRVLLAILFLFLPVSCVADDLFDIKPVAEGVYAAIAKPAYKSIATPRSSSSTTASLSLIHTPSLRLLVPSSSRSKR